MQRSPVVSILSVFQQFFFRRWLSSLEATKWLFNISSLMKTALLVVKAIGQDRQHVVVHCSDGWDRTTQVVALAELLLDPFYRTIKVSLQVETIMVQGEKKWVFSTALRKKITWQIAGKNITLTAGNV